MVGDTTVDIVIPSMRLDAGGLPGALALRAPAGVKIRYIIVSDNPDMRPGEFVHDGSPVSVIVNAECLGAPLSRNVGLEAGTGRYVLFIDDDVKTSPDMLYPYMDAIRMDPGAPGYVGPTLFPEPVNSFTRGILASGMLTFFVLPATPRQVYWGTTSNLMVRRDSIRDARFSERFPKHGGGEDIDFCLRVAANAGRPFRTVPGAAVRHPWWRKGGRSYTRFFRWAFGDSSLVRMHPGSAYLDVPDLIETLAIGTVAMASAALAGAVPPAAVAIWAGLAIASEFVVEPAQVRSHHPGSTAGACMEAAAIRISSQIGRFLGPLSRGDIRCIFRRFDYIGTGEWKAKETRFTRAKFALFAASAAASYWLGLQW